MKNRQKTTHERLNDTILEMANSLYRLGKIDTMTLREIETIKLPEVPDYNSTQIKKLRLKQKVSQAVFAKILNTSVHTIRDWEQGKKHPRGASMKLLNLVDRKGIDVLM